MNAFFTWQHAILRTNLEPTTKLVCHTIGCHMAMDGTGCFPSYALIAEESGLGRRTVIEHVQKAAEAGFLVVQSRERENGSSTTNLYQPVIPSGVQQPHPGGAGAAPGVVQQPHPHNNPSLTSQRDNPSVSPQPTKATKRANPGRSIALILEDLTEIPAELHDAAIGYKLHTIANISDEWARFRNHHISVRSKHTRLDLAWDTWCRNAPKWQRGGGSDGAGAARPRGQQRRDVMAAATDTVLAELFGVQRQGRAGQPSQSAAGADPFGRGSETTEAVFVDVGAGNAAVRADTRGSGAGGEDSDAGASVPGSKQ